MATINEIKQQAAAVKNATQVGENTADRVGGALAGLAEIAEQQDSKFSDLGLLLTIAGSTEAIPITIKSGDIIEVSVKGNTTRKQFSLLQDRDIQEQDVIKFLEGSNGTKYYVATKDANVISIFSDIAETVSVRVNVVEHFFATKKEWASTTSGTALAYEPILTTIAGSTEAIPITIKSGDIIEVSVKGNTTRKQFSLLQDRDIQEQDVIKFLEGSNGTKYYVATKDANVISIFSDIAETVSVRVNVVEHFFATKKELASTTSGIALAEFQYDGFLMTGFYNDVMRLRVFSSYDGIHFDEFVKGNDIVLNNKSYLRDPDLVKNGDWYYISITGSPIYIYKTKDFKNFELHAEINPGIEERTDYWAPEIFKDVSGKFYMIFAAYRDKKEGETVYNVQTYICELNADFNSLVGTPTKLTMPTHEEGYNFDLSIMYDTDKRKYYACDFGGYTLSIFESEIISAGYTIKVQIPLINSDYYEGATIIKRGDFYYVYVTCKYNGWDSTKTKAIGVYIFNKDWVFITFKYCHIADDYPQYDINPSSEGTGNIIISEHAKILPLKFRDFNKLGL